MSMFLVLLCILLPPCIMCSTDVDFLCKCLNLLYLIKELILCDLILRRCRVSRWSRLGALLPKLNKHNLFIFYYMFIVFIRPVGIVNACTHSFTLMLQEGVHERYKGAVRRHSQPPNHTPQHAGVGRLPRGPRFTTRTQHVSLWCGS